MSNYYIVAKDANTGRYFEGNEFTATLKQALKLAPNVAAIDFMYNWPHHDVTIESTDVVFASKEAAF